MRGRAGRPELLPLGLLPEVAAIRHGGGARRTAIARHVHGVGSEAALCQIGHPPLPRQRHIEGHLGRRSGTVDEENRQPLAGGDRADFPHIEVDWLPGQRRCRRDMADAVLAALQGDLCLHQNRQQQAGTEALPRDTGPTTGFRRCLHGVHVILTTGR